MGTVKILNRSCLAMNKILSNATDPSQSGPGSNGNERILFIFKISKAGAFISVGLMSYPGKTLGGGSYTSSQMVLKYSTAQADWAKVICLDKVEMRNSSIWPIGRTQLCATTLGQRGSPHSPNLQGWSLAIRLFNVIANTAVEGYYSSVEMQFVYSAVPTNCALVTHKVAFISVCVGTGLRISVLVRNPLKGPEGEISRETRIGGGKEGP